MKIKIWGCRGSIPTPKTPTEEYNKLAKVLNLYNESNKSIDTFLKDLKSFQSQGYGGDTTCVQITEDDHSFLIDAGSGIRRAGLNLLGGPLGKGQGKVHIYFTHFHWDHLMGLPFFVPIFIPGNEIHFYSADPFLEEAIRTLFKKPFFPVPFEQLAAKIHFHNIEARKESQINNISVIPYQLDHPDPCWGLKVISKDNKVYSHCVDTECKRVSREDLGADLPLYQNIDVLYYDAQYSLSDLLKRVDWGHSASTIGVDIALRENIKKVIFTHHEPTATDEQINQIKIETDEYFQLMKENLKSHNEFEWEFAFDGMEFDL